MKRALMLALLAGTSMAHGEVLPLPLTGPAYQVANEAYAAYNRKDYDRAIERAREALRQRGDARQMNQLIRLAERDKDRRDHPQRYPDAKRKPGYIAGDRALRAYGQKDYASAERYARQAVAQSPKDMDFRMMLIEALERSGKLVEAQAATEDAIAALGSRPALNDRLQGIQRQRAEDSVAKGYAALARKDYDTAVSQADEAVERFPKEMAYRRLQVSALTAKGDLEKARAAATSALALNGNDAQLLAQRGQLRTRLGDRAGAKQDFAQALAIGGVPLREQASMYAAMGQPKTALAKLDQARAAGELKPGDEVQTAYLLSLAGDDRGAVREYRKVDRSVGLKPQEVQDAAYASMRSNDDVQAIAYFRRVLDYQSTGDLQMPAQQVFDTRRAVSDLSRVWGVTNTTTYRGASSAGGINGAPSTNSDALTNSTEVFWRPFGYRDARFVELYGRITDTLWGKESSTNTGAKALQGAVGARYKPFSSVNAVVALERTFPLGSSDVEGDWLVRLGYGSSIGTDLRVDVSSWWTSQFYAEGGRYLQDSRNYFNSEWQVGRSYRVDRISPRLVVFPHAVAAVDYDSKMHSSQGTDGRTHYESDNAGGLGVGVGARYWFRETRHKAPQSYVDVSLQYREKVFGDDSAQGVFGRVTFSW